MKSLRVCYWGPSGPGEELCLQPMTMIRESQHLLPGCPEILDLDLPAQCICRHMPSLCLVCLGLCLCVIMYVPVHMCVCACGRPKVNPSVVPFFRSCSPSFVFEIGTLAGLELAKQTGRVLHQTPRICLFVPTQCWDCKHTAPHPVPGLRT